MDTLYIVMPAYNEEANIKEIIKEWYPIIEERSADSRLVIIDDGSRDMTWQILSKEADKRPKLIALTKPNGGHGAAVLFGYRYAIEQGADYIFQTDSDGQTLPSEFAAFWRRRKRYAMVIGKRSSRQDGFLRKVVSFVLRLTCFVCFQVSLPDVNTPYRLMKAEALKEALALIPEDYNLANVMVSVIFAKKEFPIRYLPITFRPRQGGVNSINMKKIGTIGVRAVKDFVRFAVRGFQ
ncbi:MAG: glycosyltransferase family 2 protein [Lachnospiraceae bacterium]|nr:glycosyltransferase family 2 protein [Lachnospiraceae bacterium]